MLTFSEVNNLSLEEFVSLFDNVIENASVVMGAVWYKRPFHDLDDFLEKISDTLDELPIPVKCAILGFHPDLGGRFAKAGLLTEESRSEQASIGLNAMTQREQEMLEELNTKYREKFGFPFVICVRLSKVQTILESLQQRMQNAQQQELLIGIEEVKKISKLRVQALVEKGTVSSKL